jgi:flagellar biogenesis protein FliO
VELFRQLASVALVIALACAAAYWFRKGMPALTVRQWGGARPGSRRIRIVQRAPLTPHHCLHLVHMDDQEWVVATHPDGVTIVRHQRTKNDEREHTT